MPSYYVNRNAQANGDHEVHQEGCTYMPLPQNRDYLGAFPSCEPAVAKAKRSFPRANGCYFCVGECHTS